MKKMMSVRVEEELLERAKNAIWHVGRGLSITGLMEEGFLAQVLDLEKKHNKGKQFKQREGELQGRPHRGKRRRQLVSR